MLLEGDAATGDERAVRRAAPSAFVHAELSRALRSLVAGFQSGALTMRLARWATSAHWLSERTGVALATGALGGRPPSAFVSATQSARWTSAERLSATSSEFVTARVSGISGAFSGPGGAFGRVDEAGGAFEWCVQRSRVGVWTFGGRCVGRCVRQWCGRLSGACSGAEWAVKCAVRPVSSAVHVRSLRGLIECALRRP